MELLADILEKSALSQCTLCPSMSSHADQGRQACEWSDSKGVL